MSRRNSAAMSKNRIAIGFLTALVSNELVSAEHALRGRGWTFVLGEPQHERAGITSWQKEVDGRIVHADRMAINGMGQATSAIETFAFLTRTSPTISFLVGIAGSMNQQEVHREDVVIGSEVSWRGQNKVSQGDPCPVYRPKLYGHTKYSDDLLRRISRFHEDNYPVLDREISESATKQVHFGEILTWDYVLNNEALVVEHLRQSPSLRCVEMEAGGFLKAQERYSQVTGKPGLGFVIRGISDYAAKKIDSNNVRSRCSERAAHVAIDLAEWMTTKEQLELFKSHLKRSVC